ncbi:MAG TPA: hypothetical protein VGR29_10860 [Thermomicrobiales bacterium]|nr:hypothetical protein [Thermomicrobiales bacterium]
MDTNHNTRSRPRFEECDEIVRALVVEYVQRLGLPADCLWVTTDRSLYSRWLRRRIPSSYGGAYCFLKGRGVHAVLINLERIDRSRPRAVEVVVAEELIHMRDHLDRDYRRHAKHGYDRVAHRVSALTGASLEEIRSALIPVKRRPYKYVYACPHCEMRVARKRTGRWSCPRCSPRFHPRFVLQVVERMDKDMDPESVRT